MFLPPRKPFHWYLLTILEGCSLQMVHADDAQDDIGNSSIEDEAGENFISRALSCSEKSDKKTKRRYNSELRSFVVARSDQNENQNPTWIVKFLPFLKNKSGEVQFSVHLHGPYDDSDFLICKYGPPYKLRKQSQNELVSKDDIPSDSVFLNFKILNRIMKLPSTVQSLLRARLATY